MSAVHHCFLIAALAATAVPAGAAQRVHARIDEDGRLQLTAQPVPGSQLFNPHVPVSARRPVATQLGGHASSPPASMRALFERAASEAGIEAALLHAIAWHESRFNPRAVSRSGAAGVMQLMPHTAKRFGVDDRFDVAQNLRGGARYLAWLLDRYGNDVTLAVAAYNAGEGNVQKHGNRIPPFPETQHYVRRVLHTYAQASHPGALRVPPP